MTDLGVVGTCDVVARHSYKKPKRLWARRRIGFTPPPEKRSTTWLRTVRLLLRSIDVVVVSLSRSCRASRLGWPGSPRCVRRAPGHATQPGPQSRSRSSLRTLYQPCLQRNLNSVTRTHAASKHFIGGVNFEDDHVGPRSRRCRLIRAATGRRPRRSQLGPRHAWRGC